MSNLITIQSLLSVIYLILIIWIVATIIQQIFSYQRNKSDVDSNYKSEYNKEIYNLKINHLNKCVGYIYAVIIGIFITKVLINYIESIH